MTADRIAALALQMLEADDRMLDTCSMGPHPSNEQWGQALRDFDRVKEQILAAARVYRSELKR